MISAWLCRFNMRWKYPPFILGLQAVTPFCTVHIFITYILFSGETASIWRVSCTGRFWTWKEGIPLRVLTSLYGQSQTRYPQTNCGTQTAVTCYAPSWTTLSWIPPVSDTPVNIRRWSNINPHNAEIFLNKPWWSREFFNLKSLDMS